MRRIGAGLAAVALCGALAGCAAPASDVPVAATPVVDAVGVEGVWLSASAHVEGVAESGGTCHYTFWSEGGGASRLTSSGTADGDRTVCEPVEERILTLWPGDYDLVVEYVSPTASGRSEPAPVTVPEH